MKRNDCNANQRLMWNVVCREANNYIGGLENTLMDYEPETEEYKQAKAELEDFDSVKEFVASEVLHSIEWEKMQNTHFITREWLDTRIFNLTRKILRGAREDLGMDTTNLPAKIED